PGGLANDGDIGRVTTEGFNVFLHPLKSYLAVINSSVGVRFIAWKLHKTLQAHAVTQLDLDNAVARIRRALGTRVFMGSGVKAATVDIDDYRVVGTGAGIVRCRNAECDFMGAFNGGSEKLLWRKLCWLCWREARG